MARVQNNSIYIAKFGGFVTDVDDTHIPNSKFLELVNLELKNGELYKIKGYEKKYQNQLNSPVVLISQLIRHDNENKLFYFNNEGIYSEDEDGNLYLFNNDYNGFQGEIRGLSFQDKLFIVAQNEFPFFISKDLSKYSLNVIAKIKDGFSDKFLIVDINDENSVLKEVYLPEYDGSLVYAKYQDENYIYLFSDKYVYKFDFGNEVFDVIKWKKLSNYKIIDIAFNDDSFNIIDDNDSVNEFDYNFNEVSINYQEHRIYIDKLENNINNGLFLTFIYKGTNASLYDTGKQPVNEDGEPIGDIEWSGEIEYWEDGDYLTHFHLFVSYNSFFNINFDRDSIFNDFISKFVNFKDYISKGNIYDFVNLDFIINEIFNFYDNRYYHIFKQKNPLEDGDRLYYEFKIYYSYFIPAGISDFQIKYKDKVLYIYYKTIIEKATQLKIIDNNDNEVYLDKFTINKNGNILDNLAFFVNDYSYGETNILYLGGQEYNNFGDIANDYPDNVINLVVEKYIKIELTDDETQPNISYITKQEYDEITEFDNLYNNRFYIMNKYLEENYEYFYDELYDYVLDLANNGMSDLEIKNYIENNINFIIEEGYLPTIEQYVSYFGNYVGLNLNASIEVSIVSGELDEIIDFKFINNNLIKISNNILRKSIDEISRFYYGIIDCAYNYKVHFDDFDADCYDPERIKDNGIWDDYAHYTEFDDFESNDYIENKELINISYNFNVYNNFDFVRKLFFDKIKYDFNYEINPYIYEDGYNDWIVQYIGSPYIPFVVIRNNIGNINGTYRFFTTYVTSLNTESESLRSPYTKFLTFENAKAEIHWGYIPDNLSYDILKIRIYAEDENNNIICIKEISNGDTDWNNGYIILEDFNSNESSYKTYPILPKSKIMTLHLDRLIISGGDENPNYIYFSETNYPEIFTPDGFITIQPNDGDFVTALISVFDRLYIFKNNYIYAIVGDIADIQSPRLQISQKYGCISTDSIAVYKDTVIFLSNLGICLLVGNKVVEISKGLINDYLFNNFTQEELRKSKGIFDFNNKTYRLYIKDKVIVTDLNTNYWIEDKLNNGEYTAINFIIEDINRSNVLLFATSFRYIFKDGIGDFFDGYERFCYLKTKKYKLSSLEGSNILYNISLNVDAYSPLVYIDSKYKKAIDFKNKNGKFIIENVGNVVNNYISFILYESSYYDFRLKDIFLEYE